MAERSYGHDPAAAERPEAATGRPHEGWAGQPQASYDMGDSGGWGGPDSRDSTGPVPRLSRTHPAAGAPTSGGHTSDRGSEGEERARFDASPTTGETSWHVRDLEGDQFNDDDSPAADDTAREHDPLLIDTRRFGDDDEQGWGHGSSFAASGGGSTETARTRDIPRALADPAFRLRATRALVPVTYVILILFLVLDFMRSIFNYSGAATDSAGGFVGMLILLAVGVLKIIAVTFLARLVLELCLNVAEMRVDEMHSAEMRAESGRGRRA